MSKYHFPKLSDKDWGFIRIGGPGLANCMFVASRAYIQAKKEGTKFISPTWRKFSIGPIIRKERDKRVYNKIFNDIKIKGIQKIWILWISRLFNKNSIVYHNGLGAYFQDLNKDYPLVKEYFDRITHRKTLDALENENFTNVIGVHVRLGDYSANLRISINWYTEIIKNISKINPNLNIYIFSDGSDEELLPLTSLPNVKRKFFGNAFADITALSRCKLIIASDSTFSAWGAFLGQVPVIFNRRHFPPIYNGNVPEAVIGDSTNIPAEFHELLKS